MACNQIQTYYPNEEDEEEELKVWHRDEEALFKSDFCNGNNEMVKIFNEECVICFENPSVYAVRQCGHQCICEKCHEKKRDIDKLKGIICRTYIP